MKIITTAICSVFLLRKKISYIQWLALGLLAIAVALVQVGRCMIKRGVALAKGVWLCISGCVIA